VQAAWADSGGNIFFATRGRLDESSIYRLSNTGEWSAFCYSDVAKKQFSMHVEVSSLAQYPSFAETASHDILIRPYDDNRSDLEKENEHPAFVCVTYDDRGWNLVRLPGSDANELPKFARAADGSLLRVFTQHYADDNRVDRVTRFQPFAGSKADNAAFDALADKLSAPDARTRDAAVSKLIDFITFQPNYIDRLRERVKGPDGRDRVTQIRRATNPSTPEDAAIGNRHGGRFTFEQLAFLGRTSDGQMKYGAYGVNDSENPADSIPAAIVTLKPDWSWSVQAVPMRGTFIQWVYAKYDLNGPAFVDHAGTLWMAPGLSFAKDGSLVSSAPPGLSLGRLDVEAEDKDGRLFATVSGTVRLIHNPKAPAVQPGVPAETFSVNAEKSSTLAGMPYAWMADISQSPIRVARLGGPDKLTLLPTNWPQEQAYVDLIPLGEGVLARMVGRDAPADPAIQFWDGKTWTGFASIEEFVEARIGWLAKNLPRPVQISIHDGHLALIPDGKGGLWYSSYPPLNYIDTKRREQQLMFYDGSAWHDLLEFFKLDPDPAAGEFLKIDWPSESVVFRFSVTRSDVPKFATLLRFDRKRNTFVRTDIDNEAALQSHRDSFTPQVQPWQQPPGTLAQTFDTHGRQWRLSRGKDAVHCRIERPDGRSAECDVARSVDDLDIYPTASGAWIVDINGAEFVALTDDADGPQLHPTKRRCEWNYPLISNHEGWLDPQDGLWLENGGEGFARLQLPK